MRWIKIIFVFVLLTVSKLTLAQIYPVQLSAQLIPPYSGYLPDYADPTSEKLKVILQFNDFTTPQYNIRLKLEIKGNGFSIVTKQLFNPPPLTLQSGVPLLLSGADLAPYLNSNNLDFIGINQAQYEQRMALPEGYYSVCVKAYDYYNPGNIQVSNEFCSQAWFMLSDPPFLNLPQCGKNITPQTPQNILFQWTPMHMSSPNSAANTEYEFSLWEVRPDSSANPNQVVLSTAPVFSTTTNLTLLNYGIAEPPLNLYMKYVWRVRARDITGRDWFKNNGNSQICTFVYGNLQTVLGNALNLSLSAEGVTHRLGRCSWNTQSIYSKYLLQVRKAGTQNWFDYYCESGFEKVNNLEPNTSYEARVRGEGTVTGEWSNIAAFNTTSEPVYGCNDQTQYADVLAAQPLPVTRAIVGLVIQSGQFEVIATQIYPNGPPGWYSGKGYAKVFGVLPLQVEFSNIYIDDNNRHQQGVIQAVTQGIDNWLHQWDVKDAEENAQYVSGTVDSVYVNGNQICVKIQGNIGDSCFAFPPNQNVIVVRDDNGNQWTVTVNPPPPTVTGPTNYYQVSSDELDAGDSTLVTFAVSPAQQYGFDEKKYTAWTNNYELIKLRNGKNYFVPYKSVKEFSNDEVYANIDITGFEAGKLIFKADNGFQLTASTVNNTTYKINVPYQYKSVYAWYDGKKVGKLNVVSLKTITKKLVIVPIGNANISTTNLQADINKIFGQANVSWNVSIKSAFTYNLGSDGLEAADATLMSKYSTEMRALRDAYKQANADYDKEAYYVFVVNNFSNPELKGYMVRGRALGFVAGSATSKEIAHELAHGAFGLEHTFPAIAKNTSDNLLDYGTGTELGKVQWEGIQNNKLIFSWLDEEEDGSLMVFENAKSGDFIFDDNFIASKYLPSYSPTAINDDFIDIQDGWAVLFHILNDGAKVFAFQNKTNNKTYFWDETIGWYKDNNNLEFDNWWAYDILNAGTKVVRPLVMMAGGDPQGCKRLKDNYKAYNGNLIGFITDQAVGGAVQLFKDLKQGGYVRNQALLTIWYSPMSSPGVGLGATIISKFASKLSKVGVKIGGKTLQTITFVTAFNAELFKYDLQSLAFTFKGNLLKTTSKRVLYKFENIKYNTELDNVLKNGSIELVEDASGGLGWKISATGSLIESTQNLVQVTWKNSIKGWKSIVDAKDFWSSNNLCNHFIDGDFYLKFDKSNGNLLFGNYKTGEILGFYEGSANSTIVSQKGMQTISNKLKIYHGSTGAPSYITANVSSGARIISNPNKTATIVGNFQRYPYNLQGMSGDMKNLIEEICGNLKTQQFGAKKNGFNILNVADERVLDWSTFWDDFNKPWLQEAINRGDDIWSATNPLEINLLFKNLDNVAVSSLSTPGNLVNYLKNLNDPLVLKELTGFGKETQLLSKNGFIFDSSLKMFKK